MKFYLITSFAAFKLTMQTWQLMFCFTLVVATTFVGCERRATTHSPALKRLVDAIDADDVDAVRKALKVKPELEPQCGPYEICKPLALAAGRGNLEIVKLLIDAGADPNGKNAYDDTAFINAENAMALTGKTNEDVRTIRKYLIEHGTDVNQPNAFAMTPFMGLCASNDLELAKLALKHGADVNAAFNPTVKPNQPGPEPGGDTALIWAASEGNEKIVVWLLANGANVHHLNNKKESALDVATKKGHTKIVKILSEAGTKTNSKER